MKKILKGTNFIKKDAKWVKLVNIVKKISNIHFITKCKILKISEENALPRYIL